MFFQDTYVTFIPTTEYSKCALLSKILKQATVNPSLIQITRKLPILWKALVYFPLSIQVCHLMDPQWYCQNAGRCLCWCREAVLRRPR